MTASIRTLGDACLVMRLGETIDPDINDRCLSLAAGVRSLPVRGIRDVVPAYAAVTVHFDPLILSRSRLLELVRDLSAGPLPPVGSSAQAPVDIPVSYGGDMGPDLASVAQHGRCTEADVITLHSGREYRVYMVGFLPGFAYLGDVDERIAAPRLPSPRARIEAGSVGIAGRQTGVYPSASPGGWRIIGRTALRLFDLRRANPSVLHPGARVRFVPV